MNYSIHLRRLVWLVDGRLTNYKWQEPRVCGLPDVELFSMRTFSGVSYWVQGTELLGKNQWKAE